MHKKGNVKDPGCYRSVSLIPLFGKVLERVVYLSLLRHVNPVMSPAQHGFAPGRSCATNLASLLSVAWDSIAARCQTDCVYTDFSAAFQSVDHTLLLHKLKNSYNISGSALQWFSSYLENRQQRVVVNGQCSAWCRVTSGTPEGGIISALLFAMFINDLPLGMSSGVLMFADDAKLYRQISDRSDALSLQDDLNRLGQWSQTWKLKLNASKCKSFSMTLKTNPLHTTYHVNGVDLEHVEQIRDLGVILDTKLTFGPHIESSVKKANRALGMLIRSFQKASPRGHLNRQSVVASYCAHVRSILEYCSVIWGGAASSHTNRLERIEHKFLMWLNAQVRSQCASLLYRYLVEHFNLVSVSARRIYHDIIFLRNVFTGKVRSSFLLHSFSLYIPRRATRQQVCTLFSIPYARVSTVREGIFVRLPKLTNRFIQKCPAVDVFADTTSSFRSSLQSYIAAV